MSAADTAVLIAPEMANLSAGDLNSFITLATANTTLGCGSKRELAIAYLAAHFYTLSQRSGNGGSVTSLKEGDLAISYGALPGASLYSSTVYGQEYQRLIRGSLMAVRNRFVSEPTCG